MNCSRLSNALADSGLRGSFHNMNWDRSETIALAKEFCVYCKGEGQRSVRKGHPTPCNCVLRAIFRACYARFRHCVTKEKFMSKVSLVPCRGKDQKQTYARLDEDYMADFQWIYLLAKKCAPELFPDFWKSSATISLQRGPSKSL